MRTKTRSKLAFAGVGLAWALLASNPSTAMGFNLELWEGTGPITRNVYVCDECTFEQYLATPLPAANWSRNASPGNPRLFLPDFGVSTPPEAPGVTRSLDLLPEVEGDEYRLIARVLSATLLGSGGQGVMAQARVERGTTMTFSAGRVIHKVTRPDGAEFVLFSMSEIRATTFDPTVLGGLGAMSIPGGWTYTSEVIGEDLVIGTPGGVAYVYSVPDYWTFQRVLPVPEPSAGLLLGIGLAALTCPRRRV